MKYRIQRLRYIGLDFFSAVIAWTLFFIYRKYTIDPDIFEKFGQVTADTNLYLGITLVPLFWLLLYYISGFYRKVYRKSRIRELSQTLVVSAIGVTVIFFALILDDVIYSYKSYYRSFFTLFGLHFGFTYMFRLILTSITNHKIHKKSIGFNTVIIGSNGNASDIYHQIENQEKATGQFFKGFISINGHKNNPLEKDLPHLGSYKEINKVINHHGIEEVIIATEKSESEVVEQVISELENSNVIVKIIPKMQDILMGTVKMGAIFETPLIQISPQTLPTWQQSLKRLMDVSISLLAMILLSPLYLFCAVGIKTTSHGPIIFSQKRIGLHGKPFMMHKFRSMVHDAERDGIPKLSSEDDPRITRFGKFMRKTRLDELPQFYTVLKGDMSIVGPRPERQYFIDKILERAPHYKMLQRIKPGITSWGQVKYGYASNVNEMIQRLKYDILYLENMSLAMDFRILIYTVLIVLQGRGK